MAFGLRLCVGWELPGLPIAVSEDPDLHVELATASELRERWSGAAPAARVVERRLDEGRSYRLERGRAGDHLFSYAENTLYLLSPDRRRLDCAPPERAEPAWQRVLLDSVLATVSMLHGFEFLHASAVESPHGAVAFLSRTGGGKTSVALELVRRGAPLLCDDLMALERRGGRIVAHPAPAVANVPLAAGAPPPADLGRVLALFEEEAWVDVAHAAERPIPPAALILLERRDDGPLRLERSEQAQPLELLANALHSGGDKVRQKARFDLLGQLAAEVPTWRLRAGPADDPGLLADAVETALAALRAPKVAS
jgi:hypothetical protein